MEYRVLIQHIKIFFKGPLKYTSVIFFVWTKDKTNTKFIEGVLLQFKFTISFEINSSNTPIKNSGLI